MDLSALVNDAPRPAAAAEEWGASTARSMHHSFDADERFRSSSDEEQLKPVRQAEASAALAAVCIGRELRPRGDSSAVAGAGERCR